MGKEGNNHLKSITCQVFLIFSTSLGGVLLIHHPRGLFKSPKVTKNATKIIRSCLVELFMGKEGNKANRHKSRAPSIQRRTDRPTDRPTKRQTNRQTEWLIESRERD